MNKIFSVFLLWTLVGPARAWDSDTHAMMTRIALENMLRHQPPVSAESFEDFVATTKFKTIHGFIQALHINPATSFSFQLPNNVEKMGVKIPLIDIFATYVNEPDWGMDQNICASYANYCKSSYRYMAAFQKGLSSQAFRHMYWPKGFIKLLSRDAPVPVHDNAPLGEAPDRAQLFFDLSVQAAESGHPYWAARILAWAIHYPEDLSQPFHASQLPSSSMEGKKYLVVPSVKKTVALLSYYHLAFEGYISFLLTGRIHGNSQGATDTQMILQRAIAGATALPSSQAADLARAAAIHSTSQAFAKRAGDAALRFFPRLKNPDRTDVEKLLRSKEFQDEVIRRSQPGPIQDDFISIASGCLAEGSGAAKGLLQLFYRKTGSRQLAARIAGAKTPTPLVNAITAGSQFPPAF